MSQLNAVQEAAVEAVLAQEHDHVAGLVAGAGPVLGAHVHCPDCCRAERGHVGAHVTAPVNAYLIVHAAALGLVTSHVMAHVTHVILHVGVPGLEWVGVGFGGQAAGPFYSDGYPDQWEQGQPNPSPCSPHSRQSLLVQPAHPTLHMHHICMYMQVVKKHQYCAQAATQKAAAAAGSNR